MNLIDILALVLNRPSSWRIREDSPEYSFGRGINLIRKRILLSRPSGRLNRLKYHGISVSFELGEDEGEPWLEIRDDQKGKIYRGCRENGGEFTLDIFTGGARTARIGNLTIYFFGTAGAVASGLTSQFPPGSMAMLLYFSKAIGFVGNSQTILGIEGSIGYMGNPGGQDFWGGAR